MGLVWGAPNHNSKARKKAHLTVPWARPSGQPSPPLKQKCCKSAGGWTPGMPILAGDTLHIPPSTSLCHGSLWMCKGIWHLAMSKLEMSTDVWMSSPLRRSQKVDGCRAEDCRTALRAIQSREQSLEGRRYPGTAWSQSVAFPSGLSSPIGLLPVLRGWQWLLT